MSRISSTRACHEGGGRECEMSQCVFSTETVHSKPLGQPRISPDPMEGSQLWRSALEVTPRNSSESPPPHPHSVFQNSSWVGCLVGWLVGYVCIYVCMYVCMYLCCGLWDVSSPTRDRTRAPCSGSTEP